MKKLFVVILTFLFSTFYFGQTNEIAVSKNVDRFVNNQMKNLKTPGMAIAVVKKRENP